MSGPFFIADPHFGHANIILYESRPFKDTIEMQETIIKNWNNAVSKREKIFILGDFALLPKDKVAEVVSQLNGEKFLIFGNHDRAHAVRWWREVGFQEVSKYPIIIHKFIMLSHEPLYMNEHMPYINIHGHLHKQLYQDKSHFSVSVEMINYKPISLEEIGKIVGFDL